MKILLGPAGLPLSTAGNTADGIKKVKELGLQAIEIEFVRKIYLNPKMAEEVGKIAKNLNISLSVHCPYALNLCSDRESVVKASKRLILESADRAERMCASIAVLHAAYYGKLSKERTFEILKENFLDILDDMKKLEIRNVKLGIETMGRKSQFGDLDEVLQLCKDVDLVPCIDFSHVFVIQYGEINYSEIFDKLKELNFEHIHSHFTNVKWNEKMKKFVDVHVPLDDSPPFEPLAKEILKRKLNITIICESPLLEMDSLKMKQYFEKLGWRF